MDDACTLCDGEIVDGVCEDCDQPVPYTIAPPIDLDDAECECPRHLTDRALRVRGASALERLAAWNRPQPEPTKED